MIAKRIWEMPNSNTFSINCINRLIHKYLKDEMLSIDPFANTSKLAKITNDLNPDYDTDFNLDALDFMKTFNNNSVDFVFYDPPYSLRQVSECYKSVGVEVTKETTQSSWISKHINEIKRILKPNGIVLLLLLSFFCLLNDNFLTMILGFLSFFFLLIISKFKKMRSIARFFFYYPRPLYAISVTSEILHKQCFVSRIRYTNRNVVEVKC